MPALTETRAPSTTPLSAEQRERLRREGRIARAVEAAQRRTDGRFSRAARELKTPGEGDARSGPRRG